MITRSRLARRLERLEQSAHAENLTPEAIHAAIRCFQDTGEWPTDRHGELTPAGVLAFRLNAFPEAAHRCTFGAPIWILDADPERVHHALAEGTIDAEDLRKAKAQLLVFERSPRVNSVGEREALVAQAMLEVPQVVAVEDVAGRRRASRPA